MAKYSELFDIIGDSLLRNKIIVAVGVAAEAIRTELVATPNHIKRVVWSKRGSPVQEPQQMKSCGL